ncbi:hypothetical protein SFUMM280S_05715 [Streptomyces fumanus]
MEVRVNLTESERLAYATAEAEEKYRFCATAATQRKVTEAIVQHSPDSRSSSSASTSTSSTDWASTSARR